jgi:hypothetical protein
MGDFGQPPGGQQQLQPQPVNPLASPQITMTPERSGDGSEGAPCRMRSFDEIIADEKKNRNTLTVKLLKIVKIVNGKEVKEKKSDHRRCR